jgi:hypothetical protein
MPPCENASGAEKIALAIIAKRAGADWGEYLRWKREVDAETEARLSHFERILSNATNDAADGFFPPRTRS